jgi:formylglycine-generating enzyme required for sulfatase activity/transcriptional regulator with XRE-family HTH domain
MKRFDHERLVRVRTDLNLTQEAVADAVGVDVRTYRRYETGVVNDVDGCFVVRNASRRRFLSKLCSELGVEEGELLVEIPEPSRDTAKSVSQAEFVTPADTQEQSLHTGAIDEYLARIRERCRFIDCVGLGTALQVRLPIDAFYVPLRLYLSRSLEGHEVLGRFDPEVLERGELVATDVPLDEAFRTVAKFNLRGFVLLGDAGSGKTTAVRYLCWRFAHTGGAPFGLPRETVPVLLSMRRCRPEHLSSGLTTWCSEEWRSPHAPELQELGRLLVKHGPVLWIFDGLDEIAAAPIREAASRWIHEAMLDRPSDTFVITSRYAGYSGDSLLRQGFLELHLQPLDVQQSQTFIRQWYGSVESQVRGTSPGAAQIAERDSAALISSLDGRDLRRHQLGAVATNPLLLSILCLVHRRTSGAALRRTDLYRQCVAVLLEHWLHTKNLPCLEQDDACRLMCRMAWELHLTDSRTELSCHDAARLFSETDVALLHRIRDECGLIVTARPGYYAFLHLTFQEYFAAVFACESDALALLVERFSDSWWREVVLLFAGLVSPEVMDRFVASLLRTDALEAHTDVFAQCIDAAQNFPIASLMDHLAQWRVIGTLRLRGLLRLMRGQNVPQLRGLCESLLQHEDGGVVGLAKEILSNTKSIRISVEAPSVHTLARANIRELDFVKIPEVEVMIGSDDGHANEKPALVTVRSFALSRYLVTNEQYRRFLSENQTAPLPRFWSDSRYNGADQPVVGISWYEAVRYCEWADVRLPTEFEWETACRAGTRSEYWAGDGESALRMVGWYTGNAGGRLHAVGELPANPFGLHDMHGNVWEWCADWYAHHYGGPTNEKERVLRGGYWNVDANRARSSYRGRLPPGTRGFDLGFRVAR